MISNIPIPQHVNLRFVYPTYINVSIRLSVGYDSIIRDANTIQHICNTESLLSFHCNLGSPSQSSTIRRKTCHAPNTATLQHDGSIRANRTTVLFVDFLRKELMD